MNKNAEAILKFKDFLALWPGSEKSLRRWLEDGSIPKYQPGGPRTLIAIPRSALALPTDSVESKTQATAVNKTTIKSKPADTISGPPPK